MHIIKVNHITKNFGSIHAVQDLGFSLSGGGSLDLLGPNGAGKTTTIRMILDIFMPNTRSISVLGGTMKEAKEILEILFVIINIITTTNVIIL